MSVETFTTAGSSSWTVPADVTSVEVECWGGGGAGGGNAENNEGGGGGGGAYAKKTIAVTPGASVSYYVGAGGLYDDTLDGEDTWFSSSATVMAKRGAGCSALSGSGAQGGQSASSVGDTKYSGGNGANSATNTGGGGGSSAGTASNGASGSGSTGGAAPSGGGNGGTGGTSSPTAGTNGSAPGGGGGGGNYDAGGNGAAGQIRLTYTVTPASGQPTIARLSGIPGARLGGPSFGRGW